MRDLLVVDCEQTLSTASTAVLGGGLSSARCIVSIRVPPGYAGGQPAADIGRAAADAGVKADVGLMTAVPLDFARVAVATEAGVSAAAVVTVGIARAWAAGSSSRRPVLGAGTINIITVVDATLTATAALNLIATVTEAKVLALLDAGIRTDEGEAASGTATDAVVIAWPRRGSGRLFGYGGPATPPGWAAARATRSAIASALGASS
jgi:adenosylcobinamide amidohydrolase